MENNFKRFLSLMLALIMVVGMMPMGHAHAEEAATLKVADAEPCSDLGLEIGDSAEFIIVGGKAQGRTLGILNDGNNGQHVTSQDGNKTGIELLNVAVSSINSDDYPNAFWTITRVDENNYTLGRNGKFVVVKNNNYVELVEESTIQIRRSTNGSYADYWEILNDGPHYLNYFDSFGNATSTGWAASSWEANGPGSQWEIYKVVEKTMDEIDPWGKRNWVKVSVDTETVNGGATEGDFEKAWDNNPATHWHSNWDGATDVLNGSNSFAGVINFGQVHYINQFSFTPRTDVDSGQVTKASLYVSATGTADADWTLVAEHVTFAANREKKTFCFEAQDVQYVKFVAEDAQAPSDQPNLKWVAVSEFDINYDDTHTFSSVETPATCGEDGYTTYSCSCGYSYTTPGEAATGEHSWGEGVYTDPTTEADGYTTYTCSVCGDTKVVTDEGTQLPPSGPTFTSEKLTGLTGTASSNDANDGSNIEEAFDGITNDAGNYWASVQNDSGIENNEYLIANLNGKYLINQVAYTSRTTAGATGNLNDYVIWVSTDGETWEKVAEGVIETLPGTTTIAFTPVEATHVKLTATQSVHWRPDDVNKVMACAEFEVFKAVCEEHAWVDATCTAPKTCSVCGATEGEALGHTYTNEYDPDCNVCNEAREVKTFTSEQLTGLTGTASSNDANDGSNIEEAFDGITDDGSNYWASVQNDDGIENNEYLIANLNGKYLINQVAYTSRTTATATGNLNDYVIWVSTDGETWEKVAEGTIEALPGTTVITFDAPVEATHVKLTATQSVHWRPEDVNKVMAAAEFAVFKAVCDEHTYGEGVVTAEPTCTEAGVKTYTCSVCGHTYTEEIAATGHSYDEGVVTTEPTCGKDGVKTFTCTCGDSYTEVIPATGAHTPGEPVEETVGETIYKVVYCSVCGAEISREEVIPVEPALFNIAYTNMSMANDLQIHFAFAQSNVENTEGCYAIIVKKNLDGTTEELRVDADAWKSMDINDVAHYYVTFADVAAKEMTDNFEVTIYNAKGEAISNVYTDSIEQYALRNLNGDNELYKKVVVDMLNYGAEAQKLAGYNPDNLANANLTEDQKAYATETVVYKNEMSFKGNGKYLANVRMVSNIQFMMAFSGIDTSMKAVVTFKNWEGKEITKEIDGTEFVKNGGYYVITIEETVIADGRLPINCKIYDGETVVAEVTDSIASYAARTTKTPALYEAIMKFSDSALAYLQAK